MVEVPHHRGGRDEKLPSKITVGIMFRFDVSPVTRTEANHSTRPVMKTCFQLGAPAGR